MITLDKALMNNTYKIKELNVNDSLKRRLLDLGFNKESTIKPLYKSPLGDPKSYLIKGSVIALRNKDAKNISVLKELNNNGTY